MADAMQPSGSGSKARSMQRYEPPPWDIRDLGRIAYREAWELQKETVAARHAGEAPDTLLICEHEPVITTGRGTPDDALLDARFPVEQVERGGEATYHGPGQIVVYPIVAMHPGARDLHKWLRALEQACIVVLGGFDLPTARKEGATGVWVEEERKLVSIGVAADRWVTWHGLALNHSPDLEHFSAIKPCGFDAGVMTSVEKELGAEAPSRETLVKELIQALRIELAVFRELPAS
jgi:lipoate-protein ligase B